jgi:alanine racemase
MRTRAPASAVVYLKKVPRGTCIGYCRTFTTRRASVIATLPVGYADGYSRSLSNRAAALIGGQRCPVVGRVSMDMITVDVTGVRAAAIGDEAVLIGAQGAERIQAEEVAAWAGTINYEVTCGISYRVPRVLVK